MKTSNFNKFPQVSVTGHTCTTGWTDISSIIQDRIKAISAPKTVIVLDTYHGVYINEILDNIRIGQTDTTVFDVSKALLNPDKLEALVEPFVTDDPVFGFVTTLDIADFFDPEKVAAMQEEINAVKEGAVLVAGIGASLFAPKADILIYVDMPRWEIQLRFRNNSISNLGTDNAADPFSYQYKRSFFVDWKVCDKHKQTLMDRWDFVLDTTIPNNPKMVSGKAISDALEKTIQQPFRVAPFFDPGPLGWTVA